MTVEANRNDHGAKVFSLKEAWNSFDKSLDRLYVDSGLENLVQSAAIHFSLAKTRVDTTYKRIREFVDAHPTLSTVVVTSTVSIAGTVLMMARYQRSEMRKRLARMEKKNAEGFKQVEALIKSLTAQTEAAINGVHARFDKGFTLHQTARSL